MSPTSTAATQPSRIRAEHLGPDRRRPQVLDTALEIAAELGVASVTMGAIAERMNVTRPVVYACFASRGEVLTALLDRETDRVLREVSKALPPARRSRVERMFVDGFVALLKGVEEHPTSWRIVIAHDPDPALSMAIATGRRRIADQVGVVMRPLLEHWQVADVEHVLPALVEVFMAIGETAVTMLLDPTQEWTPESLADILGRAAYRALRHV